MNFARPGFLVSGLFPAIAFSLVACGDAEAPSMQGDPAVDPAAEARIADEDLFETPAFEKDTAETTSLQCEDCEDPPPPPPPPASCTNGAQIGCWLANGCEGRKTCTNGSYGACADVGLCPRQGCPVDRQTVVRANPNTVPPDGWACTTTHTAYAGETIHVRSISTGGNYLMILYRNGTEVARRDTGAGDFWKRITYSVPSYGSYQACYWNTDWIFNNGMRFTMDVAGAGCDQNPDECFAGLGPGCTLCNGGDVSNGMLRNCPIAAGSEKHDTCCSVHPGGDMCDDGFPADYSCAAPPGYNQATYRCCKAEWDRAVDDTLMGNEWRQDFDSTLPTYRPTQVVSLDYSGNWQWGQPAGNGQPGTRSYRAPSGERIHPTDAQYGWCASGAYLLDSSGAICQ